MRDVYLINEALLFEPDERRLCLLADYPQKAVVLHTPVSECFYQLLEKNGEVLSQRFLFDAVWGKNGAVVTTNTLYQAIASLRKGLKAAGLHDDIIKTIPKAGFKSIAHIRKGGREEIVRSANVEEPKASPPIFAQEESAVNVTSRQSTLAAFFFSRTAYIVAAIFFCLSCSVLYLTLNNEEQVFADYKHMGKVGECNVWSSWPNVEKSRHLFTSLSEQYPVNCQSGDIAYMTVNRLQQGTSVMICDQEPWKPNAECRSIFYRQKYHEN